MRAEKNVNEWDRNSLNRANKNDAKRNGAIQLVQSAFQLQSEPSERILGNSILSFMYLPWLATAFVVVVAPLQ